MRSITGGSNYPIEVSKRIQAVGISLDTLYAYVSRGLIRPEAVAQTGTHILQLLAAVATGGQHIMHGIAQTVQKGWVPHDELARGLLAAALILCADQELNVTTFTARCVASAGSSPYAVVCSGLAALQGIKHAGQTDRTD